MNVTFAAVVSNFNHGQYLSRCIDAILEQSRPFDEIYIIDDCSTDNSRQIISSYENFHLKNFRVFFNKENKGNLQSANDILERITSDYFMLLAADDYLDNDYLQNLDVILSQCPSKPGVCSARSVDITNRNTKSRPEPFRLPVRKSSYISPDKVVEIGVAYGWWFKGGTCAYRSREVQKLGGFPFDAASFADVALSIALAANHGAIFIAGTGCFTHREITSWSSRTMRNHRALHNTFRGALDFLESSIEHPKRLSILQSMKRQFFIEGVMLPVGGKLEQVAEEIFDVRENIVSKLELKSVAKILTQSEINRYIWWFRKLMLIRISISTLSPLQILTKVFRKILKVESWKR